MNDAPLFLEVADGIATVVMNRPQKRNAFTQAMWMQLADLVGAAVADEEAKVLVLRSSDEKSFSAGADIGEFVQLRIDPGRAKDYDDAVRKAEMAVANCSKPTIAMISGFCVGGGCELAVACDFRFAALNSTFGITPSKIGLIYSLVATKRLADLVGPANAKLLLMSGELVRAEQAQLMGLITELCAPEQVRERTYRFARIVASRAQLTVRGAKSIVAMILNGAVSENAESTALREQAYGSNDYREGIEAFLEGRAPNFR